MTNSGKPFWGKTLRFIRDIWPLSDSDELKDRIHPELDDNDLLTIKLVVDECIGGKGGEVSARTRAAELGRAYSVLDGKGRRKFLGLLARDYGVENERLETVIREREGCDDPLELQRLNQLLRNILEPSRTKLLRQFNELDEGVKFLVDLRAELLGWAKEDPWLKELDQDVLRLLISWFDIGFLDLRRITWDTPAAILEKLIQYEAVHAISSWQDLKNRLRSDRRCYGFFHPRMPDEPLIFVEVALVNGLAGNVQELLDVNAPVEDSGKADTAIFYSISNCQKGLAGVSFGNFLIKRVVADLASKLPNIQQFSTLSPIPGFLPWLKKEYQGLELTAEEETLASKLADSDDLAATLQPLFATSTEQPEGVVENGNDKQMLLSLCSRYLLEAKRRDYAYDKVAHFHLSNGARIKRMNWGGNVTPAGLKQSAGIMVNYLYNLAKIEKNHELYTGKGEISVSSRVKKLIKA